MKHNLYPRFTGVVIPNLRLKPTCASLYTHNTPNYLVAHKAWCVVGCTLTLKNVQGYSRSLNDTKGHSMSLKVTQGHTLTLKVIQGHQCQAKQ